MTLLERLRAYPSDPDPRVAACNRIALLVAWNQPTYPLYLHWFVGGDAWVACITFLSTPVFLAVPWVARRRPLAGRALLPLAGIGNGMLSHWAFGTASGVDWFLLPCALIAALAFRRREWRIMLALIALTAVAFVAMRLLDPVPLGRFTPTDYVRFFRLNGYSVAILCALIGWNFRAIRHI
jgi:hypothetical protein